MAWASPAATSVGTLGNGTSHTINLPSGSGAGDLIIIAFSIDGAPTITWPTGDGWVVGREGSRSTFVSLSVGWKELTGTETSITITTDASQEGGYTCYRITGHEDPSTQAPEFSTGTNGADTSPDPDTGTPTGGAADHMVIAIAACDRRTFSAYPYADNNITGASGGANGASAAMCSDELNAASYNPGAFTIASSDQWVAVTVMVHPAGTVNPSATASQTVPTPTQSATGGQEFTATAAQTVPTPSQSATGAEEFAATAAQTVPTPTQSATGSHDLIHSATAAQTVPTPSQSATGAETFDAAAAQTVPTPSQAATGGHEAQGTAAQTVPTPSQSATGAELFTAAAGQTVPTPSQSATAEHSQGHSAAAAQTVPTPTQSASGAEEFISAAAQTVPTPSQSAIGGHESQATAAQTVPTPTQSATGSHASANMTATAAQTVPTPTQAGIGAEIFSASAAQTVPTPLQAATASEIFAAAAAQVVPTPSQAAAGAESFAAVAAQTVPTPLQAATASEIFVGTAAQIVPTPTQSAISGHELQCVAAQTVPTPTQSSVALFVAGAHRVETIMDAIVDAVTGLTTTGVNVYRGRAYSVEVSKLPALIVWQGDDSAASELLTDEVTSRLQVRFDALAREPANQIDTTLNLIREEITVALMADYTLGLVYVEGIMELGAEEPLILDDGNAPAAQMSMNWDVVYHHGRTDPTL